MMKRLAPGIAFLILLFGSLQHLASATQAAVPAATPVPTPTPIPAVEILEMPRGAKIAETAHFEFYEADGYFPVDVGRFSLRAEAIYAELRAAVGGSLDEKIQLSFRPPDLSPCPVRGYAAGLQTVIYADNPVSSAYLFGVLSHEIVHVLHTQVFQLSPYTALNEGFAVWIARDYWNVWQQSLSLQTSIRRYLRTDVYIPLGQDLNLSQAYTGEDCLTVRDILYTEWGAFTGYLIEVYGFEKLQKLWRSGEPPALPNFTAVYGLTLRQLETDWLRSVRKTSEGVS